MNLKPLSLVLPALLYISCSQDVTNVATVRGSNTVNNDGALEVPVNVGAAWTTIPHLSYSPWNKFDFADSISENFLVVRNIKDSYTPSTTGEYVAVKDTFLRVREVNQDLIKYASSGMEDLIVYNDGDDDKTYDLDDFEEGTYYKLKDSDKFVSAEPYLQQLDADGRTGNFADKAVGAGIMQDTDVAFYLSAGGRPTLLTYWPTPYYRGAGADSNVFVASTKHIQTNNGFYIKQSEMDEDRDVCVLDDNDECELFLKNKVGTFIPFDSNQYEVGVFYYDTSFRNIAGSDKFVASDVHEGWVDRIKDQKEGLLSDDGEPMLAYRNRVPQAPAFYEQKLYYQYIEPTEDGEPASAPVYYPEDSVKTTNEYVKLKDKDDADDYYLKEFYVAYDGKEYEVDLEKTFRKEAQGDYKKIDFSAGAGDLSFTLVEFGSARIFNCDAAKSLGAGYSVERDSDVPEEEFDCWFVDYKPRSVFDNFVSVIWLEASNNPIQKDVLYKNWGREDGILVGRGAKKVKLKVRTPQDSINIAITVGSSNANKPAELDNDYVDTFRDVGCFDDIDEDNCENGLYNKHSEGSPNYIGKYLDSPPLNMKRVADASGSNFTGTTIQQQLVYPVTADEGWKEIEIDLPEYARQNTFRLIMPLNITFIKDDNKHIFNDDTDLEDQKLELFIDHVVIE